MKPEEFIDTVKQKYPASATDEILLSTLENVRLYWNPVVNKIQEENADVFSSLQAGKSSTDFVQIRLDKNLLKIERKDNELDIIFMSEKETPYANPAEYKILDTIYVDRGIAYIRSTGETFKVDILERYFKYLLS